MRGREGNVFKYSKKEGVGREVYLNSLNMRGREGNAFN